MFFIGTTQAEAAKFDGGIKGEPDASLSILVKKIEGARYVTRINFKDVPVKCENGQNTTSGTGSAGKDGSLGLKVKQREFSGRWDYGKIEGKFKGAGKLAGEISIAVDAGPPRGECRSGRLDYVVRDSTASPEATA
jgi:hypothetical protein